MSSSMYEKVMIPLASHVPVLLVSPPGMGKSSFTRWLARKLNILHIDINLSQNEGIDVHGARIISKTPKIVNGQECTVTVQAPPDYAIDAVNAPQGALINFEELTCVPPAEAGPTLGIFSDHVVGGVALDKTKVGIIACCNPPEMSAGGWKLSLPTMNRFARLDYRSSVQEWADGFAVYWDSPPKISRWGATLPEDRWSLDRAIIADFARQHSDLVNKMPESGSKEESFCTFRSLDFASRMMTCARINGITDKVDVLHEILSGVLGAAAALQLRNFLDGYGLPKPDELLADPRNFAANVRSDKIYVCLMACLSESNHRYQTAKDDPKSRKKREIAIAAWESMWTICESVLRAQGPKDIVANVGRRLASPEYRPFDAKPPREILTVVEIVKTAGVNWEPT
jgi:hypothetical protein